MTTELVLGREVDEADFIEMCGKSENWQKQCNDNVIAKHYRKLVIQWGIPILQKTQEGNYKIVSSRDVSIPRIRDNAINNNQYRKAPLFKNGTQIGTYNQWKCPYCAGHEYMMRVLHPKYPDGYLDKGGVLQDCVCLPVRVKDRMSEVSRLSPKNENKGERHFGDGDDEKDLNKY